MENRKELLKSKEYWLAKIQIELYNQINNYLEEKNISKTDFAKELEVSKGYVSQIMNGDFNHKISKLIELSLAIGKVPLIEYNSLDEIYELDNKNQLQKTFLSEVQIDYGVQSEWGDIINVIDDSVTHIEVVPLSKPFSRNQGKKRYNCKNHGVGGMISWYSKETKKELGVSVKIDKDKQHKEIDRRELQY